MRVIAPEPSMELHLRSPRATYGVRPARSPARHRVLRTRPPQAALYTWWERGAQGVATVARATPRSCQRLPRELPAPAGNSALPCGKTLGPRGAAAPLQRGRAPGQQQCPETDLFKWSLRGARQGSTLGGRRKESSSLGKEIEASGKF